MLSRRAFEDFLIFALFSIKGTGVAMEAADDLDDASDFLELRDMSDDPLEEQGEIPLPFSAGSPRVVTRTDADTCFRSTEVGLCLGFGGRIARDWFPLADFNN